MAIHIAPIRTPAHTTPALPTTRVAAPAANTRTARTIGPPEGVAARTLRTLSASSPSSATSGSPAAASDLEANFQALFSGKSTNAPVAVAQPPQPAPTPEDAFGANPWVQNPTGIGPDGTTYGYNSQYFATPTTAAAVAQMLGGTVVQMNAFTNAPGTTFQQQQPNQMVKLPGGGLINPGLVAGFYTHGYPQSMVDQMISNEVANVKANT
jgi:hypothetical protein